jgi:hypothetical protein
MVGLLGRGISPTQGLYRHRTTQHRNTRTHIHDPSRIRTCDPNVQTARLLRPASSIHITTKYLFKTRFNIDLPLPSLPYGHFSSGTPFCKFSDISDRYDVNIVRGGFRRGSPPFSDVNFIINSSAYIFSYLNFIKYLQ